MALWKFCLILAILNIKDAIGLEDKASLCRTSTTTSCDTFQQCCSRQCQGAHDSSCAEDHGRISAAKCFCQGNSNDGERNIGLGSFDSSTDERNIGLGDSTDGDSTNSGGSSGRGATGGDRASLCRARNNNCDGFLTCCRGQCNPSNPSTSSCTPGQLWYATCKCPGDPPVSSGGGSMSHSSSGSSVGEDYTATCKRTASNDCVQFKRCCSTRCETKYTSRCSSDGRGRLLSAYCRCITISTTIFERPGGQHATTGSPGRDTPRGFQDYTQTCRSMGSDDSCEGFSNCCRTRCSGSGDKTQNCHIRNRRIDTATCTCRF